MKKLIKYTKEEIDNMPFYLKDTWTRQWCEESHMPITYIGKLAILIKDKKRNLKWITEGIDFEVV